MTITNSASAICDHMWYSASLFQKNTTLGTVYYLRERCARCGASRDEPYTEVAPQ